MAGTRDTILGDSPPLCVPQSVLGGPAVCSVCGLVRKNPLIPIARRFLCVHTSRVTGRPPRGLLPIPSRLVSKVWEPVIFNKEGTRLCMLPACLIRIVRLVFAGWHWPQLAALCWIWSTRLACFSWTSQQSACDGSVFVGRRRQSFLPPMLKCYETGGLGGETVGSHPWFRRGKDLHSVCLNLERTCAARALCDRTRWTPASWRA